MSKNQFTGTATQPQRNRKLCKFNNDQYLYNPNLTQSLKHVTTNVTLLWSNSAKILGICLYTCMIDKYRLLPEIS